MTDQGLASLTTPVITIRRPILIAVIYASRPAKSPAPRTDDAKAAPCLST